MQNQFWPISASADAERGVWRPHVVIFWTPLSTYLFVDVKDRFRTTGDRSVRQIVEKRQFFRQDKVDFGWPQWNVVLVIWSKNREACQTFASERKGSLMVRPALSYYRKSQAVVFNGEIKSKDYCNVLEQSQHLPMRLHIQSSNGVLFSTKCYNACCSCHLWLTEFSFVHVLYWPALSPDLIPTENVWDATV